MAVRFLNITFNVLSIGLTACVGLLLIGYTALVLHHVILVGRACWRAAAGGAFNLVERCRKGLSSGELEKLPRFQCSKAEEGLLCTVCLERFQRGDQCRQLPVCRHSFHAYCADAWLVRNPICPLCRSAAGRPL